MDIDTGIIASGVLPLERYAHVTNRTFPEVLERAARGVIKRGMGITPPAHQSTARGPGGGLTIADKMRGQQTISRDLHNVFAYHKDRAVVKSIQRHYGERIGPAQIVAIHRRLFIRKRMGAELQRDRALPYWVQLPLLKQLYTKLASHVGRLASGWLAAAEALKVTGVPAWVSRHGASRGVVTVHMPSWVSSLFNGSDMYIEAVNYAPNVPHWIRSETQRRVDYALVYQANAMNREMQALLVKRAQESGLQAG